jgi:putative ABC transport system permease protein
VTGVLGESVRWSWGLARRRPSILLGMSIAVALAVAFVGALGAFAASSQASLTERATRSVAVDWQVQITPQGTPAAVAAALRRTPGVRTVLPVSYAQIAGLSSTSGGVTRSTGQATVVSVPADYAHRAPGEVRYLVGSRSGILLQQQTAANLGAGPGSVITANTSSGPVQLVVSGVVDLPQSDSFFQVVGAPAGAGATAPPDNVVLVPPDTFMSLVAGSTVVHQFHVRLDHAHLPGDPAGAADALTSSANHFALSVAGGALVGDNLAASLSGAREDAIYARLLFLLLGLPGLVLAFAVAALLVGLRSDSRKRESALLLLRGADRAVVIGMAAGESLVVGIVGVALGVAAGVVCIHLILPGTPVSVPWLVAAGLIGLGLAAVAQGVPAVRSVTRFAPESIAQATTRVASSRPPWFLRMGLDVVLLVGAVVVTVLNARSGYHVVVVPEGVPVTAVNYGALLGPALAWPALVLLTWRATAWVARHRTGAHGIQAPDRAPELVASTVRRRRQVIARGSAVLAAAIGLGLSTAIFTTTYDRQSRLDVALTVGSDVSANALPGTVPTSADAQVVAGAPAVNAVASLVHRFAYVGPDLQDLFGINPRSIQHAAALQNAFVPGSTIAATLAAMAARPDGVLLSAETIKDYQLHLGDRVLLRLPVGASGYQPVPFHVVGQISEFPTAPKDSFIVANASYVGARTGSRAVSTYVMSSSDPSRTASYLQHRLGSGWRIQDITSARKTVVTASGLAATDLGALARLELGFALAFAIACTGLALGIGIAERRRSLVVLAALGTTSRQRARFLSAEGGLLVAGGLLGGTVVGVAVGYLLVAILRGIFDPPPDGLAVPWVFATFLIASVVVVGALVVAIVGRLASRASRSQLRDL